MGRDDGQKGGTGGPGGNQSGPTPPRNRRVAGSRPQSHQHHDTAHIFSSSDCLRPSVCFNTTIRDNSRGLTGGYGACSTTSPTTTLILHRRSCPPSF